jgi:two-component system, response regulator PdtaR
MNSSLRIAVADDDADMRDWFKHVLTKLGHRVISLAENGCELVEHCRALRPDLVITDKRMPQMDGIEASRNIYQDRPVPIILVSADHESDLIERAEANHVLVFVPKPIGQFALQPAIALAVRRYADLVPTASTP